MIRKHPIGGTGRAAGLALHLSRFLRAPFQFSKRAAGEAAEFSRSGIELLGVIAAARLKCGEPAAEAGELIWRQLGNSFCDFFDFHVLQYSTAEAWLSDGKGLGARPRRCLARLASRQPRLDLHYTCLHMVKRQEPIVER